MVAARTKILVVGASNAERLALMLEQKACSVTRIITTNWRPGLSGAVPDLVRQIEEAMVTAEPEIVVFEMLDNLLYMGKNQEEGDQASQEGPAGGIPRGGGPHHSL